MNLREGPERRQLLCALASGAVLAACASTDGEERDEHESDEDEGEVTPGADLMQEHGVLERILLVYGESAQRLEHSAALDLEVVRSAADLVRRFVEDYHERLEEQFVFPRLEAARREVELVATLRTQHQRGRDLTESIVRLASAAPGSSAELAHALRAFERMYRPHAAREDTVLFPAFRSVVGRDEYRELGEEFEEHEHAQVGEHGFADAVEQVAKLERALDIHDLGRFTP